MPPDTSNYTKTPIQTPQSPPLANLRPVDEPIPQPKGTNIFLLIFLLFVAVGISGLLYVFVLSITRGQNKQAVAPVIPTPIPISVQNATPTPFANPFATASAYTNPFDQIATNEAKPYENPFDTVR